MRIGLLTTSFPRWEGDVAGSFVLGFARALVTRGHRVRVLAPEPPERLAPPEWPGIELGWVRYLEARSLERTFYGAGVPDNLRRDPRAWLGLGPFTIALLRRAREELAEHDALVSHWALPSALVAARVRGERPHLAVMHSADVHALGRLPGRGRLATEIARGATNMLFVTTGHRDRFLSLLHPVTSAKVAGKCHVSAMGIDPPPERPPRRREARRALRLERFTLLAMGRLVPVKGLRDVLEAIAGRADVELLVAGEGPERDRLARHASRLGARVRFFGVVSGGAKEQLLAGADALVAPSIRLRGGRTEGVPTALLEAMSRGLPVVASRVGGVEEVVQHERSGLIVEPGQPAQLRAAVLRLAADRDLRRRLSRGGRKVARLYEWSELAPHLEALLTHDRHT